MDIGIGYWIFELKLDIGIGYLNWLFELDIGIGYGNGYWNWILEIQDKSTKSEQISAIRKKLAGWLLEVENLRLKLDVFSLVGR